MSEENVPLAPIADRADALGRRLLQELAKAEPEHWREVARVLVRTLPVRNFHLVSLLGLPLTLRAPLQATLLSHLLLAIKHNKPQKALGWACAMAALEIVRRSQNAADWFFIMRSWMRTTGAVRSAVFQQSLAVGGIPRGR